jgi:hypothetical protein
VVGRRAGTKKRNLEENDTNRRKGRTIELKEGKKDEERIVKKASCIDYEH